MHHFFVNKDQIGEKEIQITGSDVNHIRNVLRIHPGEQITVSSPDAVTYRCEVTKTEEALVTAKILWSQEADTELPSKIVLFQGLPKADKMELIIQKTVELGVSEIVPMATRRAVVKLDAKKAEAKQKRWSAIAESAAKQAKRTIIPEIKPVMTFEEAVRYAESFDRKFIPYELARGMEATREAFGAIAPGESVAIMIGPEGGFDEQEVALAGEAGVLPITLGRRILRTETAGMTVLSILMFLLEENKNPARENKGGLLL
ncbi:MAG: 16S rRNA (uracil(1498)-N(3))-methyltransferase [Lachnospiraceae bacterium]|nr:16S rRNA (uracil(1498)-N(3))-methyltransferase [Lachnospiraceae bacterium]